jgi:hypothetical protein
MPFHIVEVLPGGEVCPHPHFGFFETGAEAATAIQSQILCFAPTRKFQPRPVEDDTWKHREQARLVTDYTKGLQDIQTRMKPGKYLAKFYPDIPEPERNRLAMVIAKYDEFELNFAHSEDEIEHVYTTGPRSCMSHSAGELAAPVHPSRVYASPDLAVAYIVREDRITARAVCWPDKLRYSNIYGDRDRLSDELEELGYTQDSFDGARLLRIPVEAHRGVFVCPYIDCHANVRDDGEYLVIDDDDGDLCAQHTNGLTGEIGEECAHCEECHIRRA